MDILLLFMYWLDTNQSPRRAFRQDPAGSCPEALVLAPTGLRMQDSAERDGNFPSLGKLPSGGRDTRCASVIGPRNSVASYRIWTHCEGLGRMKATS
jgi:hypothetical protein